MSRLERLERLELLERGEGALPLITQARLLGLNRSGLYYQPVEPSEGELKLKNRIDEVYTQTSTHLATEAPEPLCKRGRGCGHVSRAK